MKKLNMIGLCATLLCAATVNTGCQTIGEFFTAIGTTGNTTGAEQEMTQRVFGPDADFLVARAVLKTLVEQVGHEAPPVEVFKTVVSLLDALDIQVRIQVSADLQKIVGIVAMAADVFNIKDFNGGVIATLLEALETEANTQKL